MATATATRPRARTSKAKPSTVTAATPGEILAITQDINTNVLVERAGDMRVVTLCMLAAKNLHMLGPGGSGKSLALREFCRRIEGANYFEKSLHAQMPADAVIGGYDMKRFLNEGDFMRKTIGKLPWAHVAFVDEITRGNGPTLDMLLTLMNTTERTFEGEDGMERSNLVGFVSASNFMPEPDDAQLGAFVDRFTLMLWIDYVQADDSFMEIIRRDQRRRGGLTPVTVTLEAFMAAQAEVRAVDATRQEFLEEFAKLRRSTRAEGLRVSDRRWVELADVARASAWVGGRDHCTPSDLAALENGLWREHSDAPTAHKLILPFLSTFEKDAAKFREEADDYLQTHARILPLVEGTPATQPLDSEVTRDATNAGRGMKVVYQRVRARLEEATRQGDDAPSLRDLMAELEGWRQWRKTNDLAANWD